jgi:hypothetical protein
MQTSEYEVHTTNGVVPPTAAIPSEPSQAIHAAGPRLPRREEWLDLPEEAYPGFRIKVWVNYPHRLTSELRSGEQERVMGALRQMVLEHNGWCDYDGAPLPPAASGEFWELVPDELAGAVLVLLQAQAGKLAFSLSARSVR